MNLSSRSEVRRYLKESQLAPKKRFGQNFLVDRHYRTRIIAAASLEPSDHAWEIGPGLGSLTELILEAVAHLVVFEVDWGLVRHLERTFGSSERVSIVAGDFRKTWQTVHRDYGPPSVVLGNLPYRLAATMIGDLLEHALPCRRMVFTVQKEVAARMAAGAGTQDYSSFSVLCQSAANVRPLFDIPPGSFLPVPEVDSTVVELSPRQGLQREWIHGLAHLVRLCFASRRKTLRRNLASAANPDRYAAAFTAEGVDLGLRAEALPPEAFAAVATRLTGASDQSDH